MAKILIAGIGGGKKEGGKYQSTNYLIEGKVYKDRSFISSALEDHFNIDRTICGITYMSITAKNIMLNIMKNMLCLLWKQ